MVTLSELPENVNDSSFGPQFLHVQSRLSQGSPRASILILVTYFCVVKLPQSLAPEHIKHLLSCFCGSGIHVWLSWVPLAQGHTELQSGRLLRMQSHLKV